MYVWLGRVLHVGAGGRYGRMMRDIVLSVYHTVCADGDSSIGTPRAVKRHASSMLLVLIDEVC